MMRVRVIFHSVLRDLLPPAAGGKTEIELAPGAVLGDLCRQLGIPAQAVGAVNGVIQRDLSRPLQDGDEVRFFRAGAGGGQ